MRHPRLSLNSLLEAVTEIEEKTYLSEFIWVNIN